LKPAFDILGLGCAAVDEILQVDRYPPADAKIAVRSRQRHCGGLCATALVAAARLGATCAYAGTLGQDDDSEFVLRTLEGEGIDTRQVIRRTGAGPVRSVIIVDAERRTRNIFYDASTVCGADAKWPPQEMVLSARVLLVDRFGVPGMIRAARLARDAGIPVIGDFETARQPRLDELVELTDHLILSEAFACEMARTPSLRAAAGRLWGQGRSAVVITCGEGGGWCYEGPPNKPKPFSAFQVRVVDTTGCGDVFHGAYAAALAKGVSLEDRLRFASAAAALKATRSGGQAGAPTQAALKRFLRKNT
jgi:sugar/nucleoside kinase (ribokinase family)